MHQATLGYAIVIQQGTQESKKPGPGYTGNSASPRFVANTTCSPGGVGTTQHVAGVAHLVQSVSASRINVPVTHVS